MSIEKVLMCGHTGSRNRGCEAIVVSTNNIFSAVGIKNIEAYTFDMDADKNVGLEREVQLHSYPVKPTVIRALSLLEMKITKSNFWGSGFYHRDVLRKVSPTTLVLSIGGDTYCYTTPWISISMNKTAGIHGLRTVFWGCSIDERLDNSKLLQEDINRYSYIVARESLSYEILKRNYKNKDHLFLACDPAFQLPYIETQLPKRFIPGNTVGINLSPVMVDIENIEGSMAYKNVCNLIRYVLDNTDMSVCLIPHVYRIDPPKQDFLVEKAIYEQFCSSDRVCLVNQELDCRGLKYIISKCRFFVGARTHSTIAAYSSKIPTLALSYSIKARGLAKDIMGSEKLYSVSWKTLSHEGQLTDMFTNNLVCNEAVLRERLNNLIPEYSESIVKVAREIIRDCT